MNSVHLHLIINHFPIVGAALSFLFIGFSFFKWGNDFKKAALVLLMLSGASSVPAYFSGIEAEEMLEDKPGFEEQVMHTHHEAAELAALASGITGLFAVAAFVILRKKGAVPHNANIALLAMALVSLLLMARAGNLGGLIRHTEIKESVSTN